MDKLLVPAEIQALIQDKPYTLDDIGLSGNKVLIFEDMVLKIEKAPGRTAEQVKLMRWLDGKVSAPRVLAYVEEEDKNYLLMTRMKGKMSCDTEYLENPSVLLEGLAEGLKAIINTIFPHFLNFISSCEDEWSLNFL